MHFVQQGAGPHAGAHRDRFNVFNLAEDLELHAAILDEVLVIRKSG